MKKFNMILVLVLFISLNLLSIQNSFSQWTLYGPVLTGISPRPAVSVADENSAWVVGGPNGSPGTPVIYRTTDGGLNWVSVSTTGIRTNLVAVYAKDADNVFVGDIGEGSDGYVRFYRTTNGGIDWKTVDSVFNGSTDGVGGIKFSDMIPDFGIVLCYGTGDSLTVFKTRDGGNNWTKSQIPLYPGAGMPFSSLTVIDSLFYAFGTVFVSPRINFTSDGGVTWNSNDLGLSLTNPFVRGTTFKSNKMTGIAASNLPLISRTTNGGVNWNVINIGGGSGTSVMRWVYGTNTIYVTSQSSIGGLAVLKSTDGGLGWSGMSSPLTNSFNIDIKRVGNIVYGYAISGARMLKLVENVETTFDVNLSPQNSEKIINSPHCVNASVIEDGGASGVGETVDFEVRGVNGILHDSGITNGNGEVQFCYTGTIAGIDTIYGTVRSNNHRDTAYVLWEVPLPVELTSFTSFVNEDDVTLSWVTASEINNSGFEVERSNVKREMSNSWINVGFVQGSGTNSSPVNYKLTDKNLLPGKYKYRLKQIDFNGNYEYYDLMNEVVIGVPVKFSLQQNYPNPFNPKTIINYSIPIAQYTILKVYDVLGNEVAALVNEKQDAGNYSVEFDAGRLSSGIYFYKLSTNGFNETKSMILLK